MNKLNTYIENYYTLLGKNENDIAIYNSCDYNYDSYIIDKKTFEETEILYQIMSINGLLNKSKLTLSKIDLLIASDLQNQLFASNYTAKNFDIPFLGVYSACASFIESLIIGAMYVKNENKKVIISTSSHNLVSEKQFRYPIEYGISRKKINSFTVTGATSALISNNKSNIKLESYMIGKVISVGHKDTNDMGSPMAFAAADTIYRFFKESKRDPNYYDLILTGDLGYYGLRLLKKIFLKQYNIKLNNVYDAGKLIFNINKDSNFAGGSGPVCLPLLFFSKIVKSKKYKKILLVGTGSLHSLFSADIKKEMCAVAHLVSVVIE